MSTTSAVSTSTITRRMPRLRRTFAAIGAGAAVAMVGAAALPGTAQAAGVATGYRYLPATSVVNKSLVSPTVLPSASSATLRFLVTDTGTLRRI